MNPQIDDMPNRSRQLCRLIPMHIPEAVLDETVHILKRIDPGFETEPLVRTFHTVLDLFSGRYPGYRRCNTEYHDFPHTNYVFLAMARLLHGAVLNQRRLTHHHINLGLMAALFHDTGYIQEEGDRSGTGAKHTATHVERSMSLFQTYGRRTAMAEADIACVQNAILCTNLSVDVARIRFAGDSERLLGQLLGTADVTAQMADRAYLEKLLFLYHEIREAGIGGYDSEVDLLRKTIGFYDFISQRIRTSLGGVDRNMRAHFQERWGIDEDLYASAIENQRDYLREILSQTDTDPRDHLKRDGIVERIQNKYG